MASCVLTRSHGPGQVVDEVEIRRLQREGSTLVHLLAKSAPDWLSRQEELLTCLQQVWGVEGKPALQMLECPVDRRQTAKALLRCFMVHCLSKRPDTPMLFEMYVHMCACLSVCMALVDLCVVLVTLRVASRCLGTRWG